MISKKAAFWIVVAIGFAGLGVYASRDSESDELYAKTVAETKKREAAEITDAASSPALNPSNLNPNNLNPNNLNPNKPNSSKPNSSEENSPTLTAKDKSSDKSGEVTIRAAIPELPEFTWQRTREWNLPLNNPPIARGSQALFMDPDDVVVGVLLGKHARAYPWHVLANYHAINDKIGSKDIIVNLCEACNGGSAFLAKTQHAVIDFRPCGLKNGTWYAIDFQTGSLWYPFMGEAFEGPLKGTKLTRIRTYFSTWRQWVRDHPSTTVVLSNDEVRDRRHGKVSHMAQKQTFNPELLARISKNERNPKIELLEQYDLVFGLIPKADEAAIAFSLEKISSYDSLLQFDIGSTPIVLFARNNHQVSAYIRKVEDETVDLEIISTEPFLMQDNLGNQWNEWGRRVDGDTYQPELPLADGYLTKWYEWLENFPNTRLETPKSINQTATQ